MKLKNLILCLMMFFAVQAFSLTAYDFEFKDINGKPFPLKQFKGKTLLIVNTASKCGYTPQYKELEYLSKIYKDQGLVVIGVPSPDFGGQEFSKAKDVSKFTHDQFSITFPLTDINHVKGTKAHPLYKWAMSEGGAAAVPKWNFHKLLINYKGELVETFVSSKTPLSKPVVTAINKATNH